MGSENGLSGPEIGPSSEENTQPFGAPFDERFD